MNFTTYFRLTSYATVCAGALALFVAGGIGIWLTIAFAIVAVAAWKLEDTRWQLSERWVLALILLSLPLLYWEWRVISPLAGGELLESGPQKYTNAGVTVLAHFILFVSVVKLLQSKRDRDWFQLYLLSFLEILLAAGLTANPAFLAALALYLLCAVSTITAFEILKARRRAKAGPTRLLVPPDSRIFRRFSLRRWRKRHLETRRLPLVAFALLLLVVFLGLPFFFIAPRTASSALARTRRGLAEIIGFSDRVLLGDIGRLKNNDEIVMHVRLEGTGAARGRELRWRGVALDEFDGRGWIKSPPAYRFEQKVSEHGIFRLGTTGAVERLVAQTFFVEPLDTPVIFAAPRAVALQAALPYVRVDGEGSLQTRPHDLERLAYKVYSDTSEPDAEVLRADHLAYFISQARYRQLPDSLDPHIAELAKTILTRAAARNGYDGARAIEAYLRDNYGYTLDLKAGGRDPLADFLFNVREGHCEYFATAMAVMLRTQGIATRVVNGFLPGEYNQAAGAFTVRQSDAHSWVEVYFPESNSWVTFDPTPAVGRMPQKHSGLAARLHKYAEALELAWFQYVIGYDRQEQRSLAAWLQNRLSDLSRVVAEEGSHLKSSAPVWLRKATPLWLVLAALGAVVFLVRRIHRLGWRRGLRVWPSRPERAGPRIDFFERLIALLAKRGFKREPYQTPLEFAFAVGGGEAQMITNAYNRVRFGAEKLSARERQQIEEVLGQLERSGNGI